MLDKELSLLSKLTQHDSYSDLNTLSVEVVRRRVKQLAAATALPGREIYEVYNTTISSGAGEGIALRIYKPKFSVEAMPAMIYFHGGGFVLYDIDDFDSFCRYMSVAADIIVVSVDYRRSPEYVFPGAHEDAALSLEWVFTNASILGVDPCRIAAGGDSAGGNLAIHAVRMLTEKGLHIALQLLIYPLLGFGVPTGSYSKYGTGYYLNCEAIDWFLRLIDNKRQEMMSDLRLHPGRIRDASFMPSTLIAVAEYDILRDEAISFHNRLGEQAVHSELLYFEHLPHNFILMAGRNEASRGAVSLIASKIHERLYGYTLS